MDILCYIIGGLAVLFGVVTALLYCMNKNKEAFVTKMFGAMSFIIAGIVAMSITSYDRVSTAVIVVGMLLSSWGDFFLARREMSRITSNSNFEYGVCAFAVSQVLFVVGFLMLADFEFSFYLLPLILLGLVPILVGKFTHMLTFKRRELWLSIVYSLLLCLTLAVNASRYYLDGSASSLIAMIGSASFFVSDAVLGLYYFSNVNNKKYLNYPIMLFYFLAEALYGISIIL